MQPARLVTKALQRYWRHSRSVTLGVQGAVLDDANRVLLVRHTYRPGWHFPGGGVEKTETVVEALARELAEEVGILLEGSPELFGLYANFRFFPGDHIALFIVRSWRQPSIPPPNREIAEQRFFPTDALPETVHRPTQARVLDLLAGKGGAGAW